MRIEAMRKPPMPRVLKFAGIVLLFFTISARAQQAPVTCNGPLTEDQVTQLLKAGVASVRLLAFVNECGVNFTLTREAEGRLRRAGASDALLKLIQTHYTTAEQIAWDTVKNVANPGPLEDFLKRFPEGEFASEARERLNNMKGADNSITCNGAMSEKGINELLVRGVSDLRVQAYVNKCGADFPLTQEVERRMRGAGASDALITLARAHSPAERQRQEEERLKQLAEEEQKNRDAARLAEVRQTLGLEVSALQPLKQDLTLDEARQRLVSLRTRTHELYLNLKTHYPDLDVSPNLSKDAFETTSAFQARVGQANAEHAKMVEHFGADLALLIADHNKQIDELLARKYTKSGLKAKLNPYDADHQLLVATVGDYSYKFKAEPVKARLWYEHQGSLEIRGNFLKAEDDKLPTAIELSLTYPQTQEELTSAGMGADISGTWKVTLDNMVDYGGDLHLTFVRPKSLFLMPKGQQTLVFDLHPAGDELTGTVQDSFQEKNKVIFDRRFNAFGSVSIDKVSFRVEVDPDHNWEYEGHILGNEIHLSRTLNGPIPFAGYGYQNQITVTRER
jgi:hypothetical protein